MANDSFQNVSIMQPVQEEIGFLLPTNAELAVIDRTIFTEIVIYDHYSTGAFIILKCIYRAMMCVYVG